jgi:hypothetical protein
MVRRHSASPSVDRRTVPSRLCISYLQSIHAPRRRVYNPPSGARPCDGCCTCNHNRRRRRRRRRNWVAVLRGGRTNWQTRGMGSGAVPLSPYVPFPFQFLAAQSTHNIPHGPATHFQKNTPPSSPTTLHLVWLDQILGADHLLDVHALGAFLERCQYKFGGIGKAPDEHPGGHPLREYPSFSFFSGFYVLSSRLRKLNACFRRSNHIARSGMETAASTRLSMRLTRLRDGPRSTFPPLRPASRNRSGRAGKRKKTV